jgi:hypothetical protein
MQLHTIGKVRRECFQTRTSKLSFDKLTILVYLNRLSSKIIVPRRLADDILPQSYNICEIHLYPGLYLSRMHYFFQQVYGFVGTRNGWTCLWLILFRLPQLSTVQTIVFTTRSVTASTIVHRIRVVNCSHWTIHRRPITSILWMMWIGNIGVQSTLI